MKKTISAVTIAAVAGLATGQTVINIDTDTDGLNAAVFTITQTSDEALEGFKWDLSFTANSPSWGSELNIILEHLPSGFSFTFDGSDSDFSDDGPADLLFGWGNFSGGFSSNGSVAVSGGPADTSGDWRVTVIEDFDDSGVDGHLTGTIEINKVPAPGSLALIGVGGLAALRRRRR